MSRDKPRRLTFLARIMHYKKGEHPYYVIYIPSEVVEEYRDLLEEWVKNKKLLAVSVEELAGMPKR